MLGDLCLLASAVLINALVPWSQLPPAVWVNPVLIAVVIVASRRSAEWSMLLGGLAGLGVDALCGRPFGVTGIVLALVAYLTDWVCQRALVAQLIVRALILLGIALGSELLMLTAGQVFLPSGELVFPGSLAARVIADAALGLLVWRPGAASRRQESW